MLTALRSRLSVWLAIEIPPHAYALLRMLLGGIGLVSLFGLTPIGLYWPLDGLAPLPGDGAGIRSWLEEMGLGGPVGIALFGALCGSFTAMAIGFRSDLAVFLCFVGVVAQTHWNWLPLSSAHQVMTVLLFCLLWAETGQVWSLDAYNRVGHAIKGAPAWPLWLMWVQVALIYVSSGLYKLANPTWRDGTAVHWALNLNVFHRFPWALPADLAPVEAFLTWGTLLFELSFAVLVFIRRLRPFVLLAGVALHAGLFAFLELGPFSLLMIASYVAFLDPDSIPRLFRRRSN